VRITRLSISNFRGIKSAEFFFDGHALLIGPNNVGKSTVCEALDLVLGPDRLNKRPPVEEFDFYNAQYLIAAEPPEDKPSANPIRIEAILVDLTPEIENRCAANLEFWNQSEQRILISGEIEAANPPGVVRCLRIETLARYNIEEDEFEAETYFSHSPNAEEGELTPIRRNIKRLFGFLYLRALRTGSRALSLEHGSLLDIILRLKAVRTGLWEKAIKRLRSLDIEEDATELEPVLKSIEQRLSRYIASAADGRTTKLHVSQLTREHLRKTMAFFLAMSKDQSHVPFQHAGTGTLNTLVLALLTFIADLKPETVIFAMEEPEIAVPPHTQRRIADYLLHQTTQAFVTSHSPYVIERFDPAQTLLLTRTHDGSVGAKRISEASGLKSNDYKRYARRGLTECMLGKGAIVVEGVTEFHALPVAARKLEEADKTLQPLDIAGVAFFDAESDGTIPKFGTFFRAVGLKTFAFYDQKTRTPEERQKFVSAFDIDCEHKYSGFEELMTTEISVDRQWDFLAALRLSGENGNVGIPLHRPEDNDVKRIAKEGLLSNKGAGWAAKLLERCPVNELPATIVDFLRQVYGFFPTPSEASPAADQVMGVVREPEASSLSSAAS
jgi:putative ATP-dependent endonuclease of OLD family